MKRFAFTMIELVFVIAILGILAVVAIPKLSTTRDDARISNISHMVMIGISEIASYATANGRTEDNLSVMSNSIRTLISRGDATNTGVKSVAVKMGGVANCISVDINTTATMEVLNLSANNSGVNPLCDILQSTVNWAQYPMQIRGQSVIIH